jgi:hypothetical protein
LLTIADGGLVFIVSNDGGLVGSNGFFSGSGSSLRAGNNFVDLVVTTDDWKFVAITNETSH